MSLDAHDVRTVAEFLSFELDEIEPQDWRECNQARWRSSISRAYYSVFLALRRVAKEERPNLRFPERDPHALVRDALENSLVKNGPVHGAFKDLRRARGLADYNDASAYVLDAATDALDKADVALSAIEQWTPEMRADFALEVVNAISSRSR